MTLTPDERKTIRDKYPAVLANISVSSAEINRLCKIADVARIDDVQVATEQAVMEKLAGVTDEELVNIIASLYWGSLPPKEYVPPEFFKMDYKKLRDGDFKTMCQDFAREVFLQLSAVYNAQMQKKVEEAHKEGFRDAMTKMDLHYDKDGDLCSFPTEEYLNKLWQEALNDL